MKIHIQYIQPKKQRKFTKLQQVQTRPHNATCMKAISKLGAERIPRPPGNCIQILASNINAILGSGPKGLSNRGDHTARGRRIEKERKRGLFFPPLNPISSLAPIPAAGSRQSGPQLLRQTRKTCEPERWWDERCCSAKPTWGLWGIGA